MRREQTLGPGCETLFRNTRTELLKANRHSRRSLRLSIFGEPIQAFSLASLDYEKCFDTASPTLCLRVMIEAGFPSNTSIGGTVASRPEHVTRSLVHGDALSCLALVVLLAAPFPSVQRSCGRDLCMTSYVDDRAGAAAAPEVILTMIRGWHEWSVKLGLAENAAKLRLVCHTEDHEHRLRLAGIPEDCIKPRCRVLGIDFTTARIGWTRCVPPPRLGSRMLSRKPQ